MNGPLLISGFLMGAAGSLHCVGMCGPLCIMLPVQGAGRNRKMLLIGSYQLGRILTYAFIGLVLGMVGRRFYLAGYQQWFSIVLGSVALLFALIYFFVRRRYGGSNNFYLRTVRRLMLGALKNAGTVSGSLMLGMANGLLPCGMVYMATLAAISFSNIQETVLFMALFGAGTVPMMFGTAWAGQALKAKSRLALQQLIPVFIMAAGCLLILRGLNLGIPFISPHIMSAHGNELNCQP